MDNMNNNARSWKCGVSCAAPCFVGCAATGSLGTAVVTTGGYVGLTT